MKGSKAVFRVRAGAGLVLALVGLQSPAASLDLFRADRAGEWVPGPGASAPAVGRDGGLRFDCPFSGEMDRVYWDRVVRLDLSGHDSFRLDLACARPDALRVLHLYLRSGAGWYVWRVPLPGNGRRSALLLRREAAIEGSPAGWDRIEQVRLSPWRGASVDTAVELFGMSAHRDRVALIRGALESDDPGQNRTAERVTARMSRWLLEEGLSHVQLTEKEAAEGGLRGMTLALLGYSPRLPDRTLTALETFVKDGGKLMVFFSADERLARLMRVRLGSYMRPQRPGQWSAMEFTDPAAWSVPPAIYQKAWNIHPVTPLDRDGRVAAWWQDAQGRRTKEPAWVATRHGYWMTHVLLGDDPESKRAMLLGAAASLDPGLWEQAAARALERAGQVDSFATLAEAEQGIRRQARAARTERAVRPLLAAAGKQDRRMRQAHAEGRFAEAVRVSRELRDTLTEAYARAQVPRAGEFRGVWDHGGAGWYPGDWDRTVRLLADHGITAVFPNMAWAGLAHYPSRTLPGSSLLRDHGDQIEACVRAARRHKLEVHIWKVCWNLGAAPDDLVRRLERENRLQRNARGETLPWLNPADPRNRRMELDSLLEIAERYPVDGIHLDYIRYPGPEADVSAATRAFYERDVGRRVDDWPRAVLSGGAEQASFRAWRARQITDFVRELRRELKAVRPGIKLSAAVFGSYPDCLYSVGQDWPRWLEEDLVDFVSPMNYTEEVSRFDSWVRSQMARPRAAGRLYPGIGVTSSASQLAPDKVIEQILALRARGAPGFLLFDLDPSLRERTLPALSLGVTR